MSDRGVTKVISIRIPAKFFKRLGYLAYHSGRLPSETARQILMDYLNLGCVACGGPVHEWEWFDSIAICVNPSCAELVQFENLNSVEDYSKFPKWSELPGFSDKLRGQGDYLGGIRSECRRCLLATTSHPNLNYLAIRKVGAASHCLQTGISILLRVCRIFGALTAKAGAGKLPKSHVHLGGEGAMTTPADMFYTTRSGLRIHYLDWGNAGATPLILIHGLRSHAHAWDLVVPELINDYHVLALDVRGRGDSDWDPQYNYNTATYVSDVEDIVHEQGLEEIVLMGHSMGGSISMVYASTHPDQVIGAVIVDSGPQGETPTPGIQRIGREVETTPISFASWDDAKVFLREQRPDASEESMRIRVQNTLKELPDGTVTWRYDHRGLQEVRRNPVLSARVDMWPHVRAIRCPTLIVRGGRSDVFMAETAQQMVEAMADGRWTEVPDAGHPVWDDNLDGFNRDVLVFLRGLIKQGSASRS